MSKCSWLALLYWYSLQTALSTFQVIYYTGKEAWQTRHQLRILLSPFFCRENLSWWPLGMSTPQEEQQCGSSSPTPHQLTPSPSPVSLSQCAATLCCVFQAFPLFQRGENWIRWGESAMKPWFSLEFLCTSQLLFLFFIKSLQEARSV